MCRKEYNPAWASHRSQKRQKSIWKIVGLNVSSSHVRWISRLSMPPLMGSARDYPCNHPRGGTSLRAGCPIIAFKYAGTLNAASLASFTAAGAQNKEMHSTANEPGPTTQARLLYYASLHSNFRSPVRTMRGLCCRGRTKCGFLRAMRYCNLRCFASMNSFDRRR
jgi:hypothetical protein